PRCGQRRQCERDRKRYGGGRSRLPDRLAELRRGESICHAVPLALREKDLNAKNIWKGRRFLLRDPALIIPRRRRDDPKRGLRKSGCELPFQYTKVLAPLAEESTRWHRLKRRVPLRCDRRVRGAGLGTGLAT